ncbi:hypothetical protein [Mycolicibacterium sp. D5.8-2]|uniref:hypothetical protein n=1 Tax=Mycolicibacterium sp. D5.8-2 TaxID=3085903 RepID=UPI00298D50A0|nr:hypothetical protein [Mycolicibacterium sp. D5.8-2]MDW5610444.1 hypothetical protein [Mycolicibacterium sp. D5.8-2]
MSKIAIPESHIGIPAGAISQAYVRLRGAQQPDINVHHAHTDTARVTLTWGRILFTFFNAQAAQGVLEGFTAARHTLVGLPPNLAPHDQQPYDGPAIAVDWTRRPPYAIARRDALTPDKRRTIHWVEVYMRPVTFQIVDLAAYRSAVTVLQLAHKTAVAVCLDGPQHRFDPSDDAYRPPR